MLQRDKPRDRYTTSANNSLGECEPDWDFDNVLVHPDVQNVRILTMEAIKGDASDNRIHHTRIAMQTNAAAPLSVYLHHIMLEGLRCHILY